MARAETGEDAGADQGSGAARSGDAGRWATAAELLRLVRAEPGLSRREAGRRLGLSTGMMSDLMERMRGAQLLDEVPGVAEGRGRPSPVITAHAQGPLVAVVQLRGRTWRLSTGDVEGVLHPAGRGEVGAGSPADELARIAGVLAEVRDRADGRVQAVSVVAAGVVEEQRVTWLAHIGWRDAYLGILAAGPGPAPLLLAENDATLAGLAEARMGAARGTRCALHLLLAEGAGGVLLVDGEAIRGARSSGGEFGHMPFGDRSRRCECGARGCWNLDLHGDAFARWAGEPEPEIGSEHLEEVLLAAAAPDAPPLPPARRAAIEHLAEVFGAGAAGIVNAHDPQLVSLGGLAPLLHRLAPEALEGAYRDGLMHLHRDAPPPLVDARFGTEGAEIGALHHGLDAITAAPMLAQDRARR